MFGRVQLCHARSLIIEGVVSACLYGGQYNADYIQNTLHAVGCYTELFWVTSSHKMQITFKEIIRRFTRGVRAA